jgi:hypothetical protein
MTNFSQPQPLKISEILFSERKRNRIAKILECEKVTAVTRPGLA